MKLRFTQRATQDLTAIGDYLRPRSPSGAARVSTAILDSMQTLTQFPNAGRLQDVEGVRKLVTRRYSYLIYYEVNIAANESSSSRSNTQPRSMIIRTLNAISRENLEIRQGHHRFVRRQSLQLAEEKSSMTAACAAAERRGTIARCWTRSTA